MLRAGTDTGSLMNHLYSRMVRGEPAPTVGMPCTVLAWTDRYACTIVAVIQHGLQQILKVQQDSCKRTDKNGISEDQDYEYTRDPQGRVYFFRKDKKGFWGEVRLNPETNRYTNAKCRGLRLGVREEYVDPSF